MISKFDPQAEWLEADGLGGFASGTVSGIRTRRYHALLLTATTPPAGRMVLVGKIESAIEAILDGYSKGTRFGIRLDECGLLACGVPGVQLTWMDAKVGDWVITPRIGKPVEIQALWLNALWIGARRSPRWNLFLTQVSNPSD